MAKRLSTQNKPRSPKPSAAYLQALRLFWQGEREAVIATITDALAEDRQEQSAPFYRLWIELLVEDEASLRLLLNHLNRTVDFKNPKWVAQYALIGLIHYELGEVEAAQIIAKSMQRHHTNAYFKELSLLLQTELDEEVAPTIARALVRNSTDYFHFQRSIFLLHRVKNTKTLQKTFIEMDELFGEGPLAQEIAFHDAFAQKDYRKAWQFARHLRTAFSVHSGYQFFYAYTSYIIERSQVALKEFLQLNRRFNGEDPDVLCMIGASLLASPGKVSEEHKRRARHYLEKATHRLRTLGLPTAYPQELLYRMGEQTAVNNHRLWIVKLTPRQSLELGQRSLAQIDYLHRAMGDYVKEGDICFFVSESRHADEKQVGLWRLMALYRAASNPEWHPIHRWQTALKLQIRLDVSIPIEIEGNQRIPRTELKGSQRYGLLEIDHGAMAHIEESIREFTLDDQVYSHIFDGLRHAGSL